jgi:hypothetical protein
MNSGSIQVGVDLVLSSGYSSRIDALKMFA